MKSVFVLATALIATSANAQSIGSEPALENIIKYQVGALWNITVAKSAAQKVKFVAMDGSTALSSANKGYISIAGAPAYKITSDLELTLPAPTVWGGGYTGTPAVYIYASYSATNKVQLCASDISTLTAVGSTATGNSGFVKCQATQGSTAPMRLLGSFVYTVATPAIGATFTRIASF